MEKTSNTAAPMQYRVVHPHPNFLPSLLGKEFSHGVLMTDDADLAKALTEYGCQVYEGESQKLALGTQTPAEQARIEKARQWTFKSYLER